VAVGNLFVNFLALFFFFLSSFSLFPHHVDSLSWVYNPTNVDFSMAEQVQARIQQASAKNKELLRILADTDHANPALEQHNRFVADLEEEMKLSNQRIKQLDAKRAKELKDHEKYRDSVMRRFAYKVSGQREKFEERADREECEYFTVLQDEHREKQMNANLEAQLLEAYKARGELKNTAQLHDDMQRELDNLYHSIFAGPTPGFPDEDQKEQTANQALQAYHEIKSKAEAEQYAVRLLKEGKLNMTSALSEMENALSHSRVDMFGGGSMHDMMERNALHKAEMQIQEARMKVLQAQRMSPFVGELPTAQINHGNLVTDVFFDNIFTDMAFHDEIKRSKESVKRVAEAMDKMLRDTEERHRQLAQELSSKEKHLVNSRQILQKARQTAFESVAANGEWWEHTPS
jgi:hypothetical protein